MTLEKKVEEIHIDNITVIEYTDPCPCVLGDMDNGPWEIHYNIRGEAIGVISNDFQHDVLLKVSGDFGSKDIQEIYCQLLADKLNGG